ncbi:GNAT family N-acetyltransferase [Spongorhabdus nitratireducens]
MSDYKISTCVEDMDLSVIHEFLTQSYWASDIPQETVEKAVKNSLCFAVLTTSGRQVGFARLITDSATFAYLADVFILEAHRGHGLSKRLMEAIISHPQLQGLRRITLATADAHGLYEQYGFKPLARPETFMEIWVPDVYNPA